MVAWIGRTESERLCDAEDDAAGAVLGAEAVLDAEVGAGIGGGEVEAVDRHDETELPIPIVVVGNAVVDEALDVLVADGAERLERHVFVDVYERHGDGDGGPLVPGVARVGEEVGAVADRGADLGDAEIVAGDEAELVEVVEQGRRGAEVVVADVAQVEGELVVQELELEAGQEVDLGERAGAGEVHVGAPGADIGAERDILADGRGLVAQGCLNGDLTLGLRDAAIGVFVEDGETGGEVAADVVILLLAELGLLVPTLLVAVTVNV